MTWEEAEQAAVDREDWRTQCVFDTGWTQTQTLREKCQFCC